MLLVVLTKTTAMPSAYAAPSTRTPTDTLRDTRGPRATATGGTGHRLAARAVHVANILIILLTAEWVLQHGGAEALRRATTVSAVMLEVAAMLLLAVEWLPDALAVFQPTNRSALQTALFGCVGACDLALSESGYNTYCSCSSSTCAWYTGTGAGCQVPGSIHGAISSWDVGRVTDMHMSECVPIPSLQPSLSLSFPSSVSSLYSSSPSHHTLARSLSLSLSLLLSQCSLVPVPSTKTSPAGM